MSEEIQQEVSQETEVAPEQQAPELSPIEQKAMELGWRPKSEYDGDEENFIDAKEFVQRQPLFDKISSQSKQLKRVEAALAALQGHYDKVAKTEYNKAMRDLKAQLEVAVEEGDLNKYHALNERRVEIEQEHKELVNELKPVAEPQVHPELQEWISRNPWFEREEHMRVFADRASDQFAPKVRAGLMTSGEALKEVEKLVRQEFPHKFRNPNKDKPSAVEGSTTKRSGKSDDYELTDQERRIMNTLINTKGPDGKPVITKAQYIADLRKVKGQ